MVIVIQKDRAMSIGHRPPHRFGNHIAGTKLQPRASMRMGTRPPTTLATMRLASHHHHIWLPKAPTRRHPAGRAPIIWPADLLETKACLLIAECLARRDITLHACGFTEAAGPPRRRRIFALAASCLRLVGALPFFQSNSKRLRRRKMY